MYNGPSGGGHWGKGTISNKVRRLIILHYPSAGKEKPLMGLLEPCTWHDLLQLRGRIGGKWSGVALD